MREPSSERAPGLADPCVADERHAACSDVGQVAAGRGPNLSGPGRLLHTGGMIRLGTSADLAAAAGIFRRASLSNTGDRENLLAHPEYLTLGPEGLAEGRTHVAEEDGSVVGFATWAETAGTIELEDLFVAPGYMRRGIASALVSRIAEVVRARGAERLEVTANPHALGFTTPWASSSAAPPKRTSAPRPEWCSPSPECPGTHQMLICHRTANWLPHQPAAMTRCSPRCSRHVQMSRASKWEHRRRR
jgi:GNAT superfamily N-acetyltransferase